MLCQVTSRDTVTGEALEGGSAGINGCGSGDTDPCECDTAKCPLSKDTGVTRALGSPLTVLLQQHYL